MGDQEASIKDLGARIVKLREDDFSALGARGQLSLQRKSRAHDPDDAQAVGHYKALLGVALRNTIAWRIALASLVRAALGLRRG